MAICVRKNTGNLYEYLGDNIFRNLVTGEQGEISTEKAQQIFLIQPEMTILCNDYPMVKELVMRLSLRLER